MNIDKIKIHAACLEMQKEEVENFESRVKSLKTDVNAHEHSASQTEERTAGNVELLSNYQRELIFSRNELTNLESLNPVVVNNKVEPGAIVMTDKLNFYISIPIDKIDIEGSSFIGISTKAPIYTAMENKKKGDSFTYNDNNYTIVDLY